MYSVQIFGHWGLLHWRKVSLIKDLDCRQRLRNWKWRWRLGSLALSSSATSTVHEFLVLVNHITQGILYHFRRIDEDRVYSSLSSCFACRSAPSLICCSLHFIPGCWFGNAEQSRQRMLLRLSNKVRPEDNFRKADSIVCHVSRHQFSITSHIPACNWPDASFMWLVACGSDIAPPTDLWNWCENQCNFFFPTEQIQSRRMLSWWASGSDSKCNVLIRTILK